MDPTRVKTPVHNVDGLDKGRKLIQVHKVDGPHKGSKTTDHNVAGPQHESKT